MATDAKLTVLTMMGKWRITGAFMLLPLTDAKLTALTD